MNRKFSRFKFLVPSFALLLALGGTAGAQWIIDGQQTQVLKLDVTDPGAARNSGTNTVYYSTANAVARWIALTNGIALEVNSSTGWVRQVEFTED